ncbi:MAG: hypothetical protein ABR537_14240 [Gemmatimonadales bacterium]
MRLTAFALFALTSTATAVAAQSSPRAELVLTILGGAVTGHGLWDLPRQPLAVFDSGGATGQFDTLHLRRDVTSSIAIGASATYFVSPHLGLHAEISYLGLPFDDSCTDIAPADSSGRNQEVCDDIQSHSGTGAVISLFVGATVRAATHRALSPYARVNLGVAATPHSSIEVVGNYLTNLGPQPVLVIADPSPRHASPLFGLGVGVTTPLSKSGGYQFRLELRDAITAFDRVTGPTGPGLVPPTASRFYHHFELTLGLDVVLEQTRGRRY